MSIPLFFTRRRFTAYTRNIVGSVVFYISFLPRIVCFITIQSFDAAVPHTSCGCVVERCAKRHYIEKAVDTASLNNQEVKLFILGQQELSGRLIYRSTGDSMSAALQQEASALGILHILKTEYK
jgi:hypothetical protein